MADLEERTKVHQSNVKRRRLPPKRGSSLLCEAVGAAVQPKGTGRQRAGCKFRHQAARRVV
jgi:hypothetical protein